MERTILFDLRNTPCSKRSVLQMDYVPLMKAVVSAKISLHSLNNPVIEKENILESSMLCSDSKITSIILKLPSASGEAKAFSACSSYGCGIILWIRALCIFFLANFSFSEICYVSTTLPRMLINIGTQRRRISLVACATQMSFFLLFGGIECLLLAVMAYDRYVAICNPLHYPLVMNHRVCIQLVTGCWTIGIPLTIGYTYQTFSLPFCGSKLINHFFCDIPPILKLACGDTFVNEMLVYTVAVLFVMVPFLWILGSYSKIISIILKLPSATSQAKAFSTCSSHLTVVVLFFGSGIIAYLRPNTRHSEGTEKNAFSFLPYPDSYV
ncbi:olfactory receptor 10AG1-like [Elephas maximus indicus]|uniref:olfactory receptor 10AG1-like n=1 Tax=Elephas maximus indicus TaxID=99487 RepID=UPI002116C834|nr:olfactory receptor 10AG1-like [Elephas maximus indicus]